LTSLYTSQASQALLGLQTGGGKTQSEVGQNLAQAGWKNQQKVGEKNRKIMPTTFAKI